MMNMNPLQLIQMLQGGGNPMQMLQSMFGQNPMFQRALQMTQGKSPAQMQQTAKNLCAQKGINFDSAVQQMQGMGLKVPVAQQPDKDAD